MQCTTTVQPEAEDWQPPTLGFNVHVRFPKPLPHIAVWMHRPKGLVMGTIAPECSMIGFVAQMRLPLSCVPHLASGTYMQSLSIAPNRCRLLRA